MKKQLTYSQATQILRKFFPDSSRSEVSLDEIFRKTKRENYDELRNRQWLANQLTPVRSWHLVESKFSNEPGPKKVVAIQLTKAGEEALSTHQSQEPITTVNTATTTDGVSGFESFYDLTIRQAVDLVSKDKRKYPDSDVSLSFQSRGVRVEIKANE